MTVADTPSSASSVASVAAPLPLSAHAALRAATAADHEAVDAAFGRFDLADPRGYGNFLQAHARALPAVEAALAGIAGLPPLRPRTPLLQADLAGLGLTMPEPLPLAPPATLAEAFGAAYVVEGSRLGGGLLARMVNGDLPRAYLSATHLPGEWRAFSRMLDAAAVSEAARQAAITGARRVFALYAATA